MKNKSIVVLAFFLILFKGVEGQSYYFSHYQVENGLSNNAVICSIQDKKGFLWFGTKDGLNRFDGYSFKIFRHDAEDTTSIGSNFIHSLQEDPYGTLWVGTEQGLYKYHAKTEDFSRLKNVPPDEIREIKTDGQGNLWFISGLTLFRYNEKRKELKSYPAATCFNATSICCTPEGQLWVATSSGLIEKYNPADDSFTAFNVFERSQPAVSRWIEKIYCTGQGSLLIGTSNQGVKLFDIGRSAYRDILTYNDDKTEIFARDFIRHSENEYWIGTESGIFIYNLKSGKFLNLQKEYNDPYSLSDNAVYTFCKDREGGIWAGTYFGGLNYYARQYTAFEKFFPKTGENSISGNAVREICPDQYGNLWIGTEDGGLNKLVVKSGKFTVFKPTGAASGVCNTNIHGLLATGDTLWIGTFEHGLDLMDIRTGRVIKHYAAGASAHSLKSNFIYCIKRTRAGRIILGTAQGLYYYDRKNDGFTQITAVPDLFYTTLFEDSRGTIWAGTYRDGLYCFNPGTGKKESFACEPGNRSSLSSNRVNWAFEDSNGDMWFATEGGLCKLRPDDKTFKRYTVENGLPGDLVYTIQEDAHKNLWISTSRGLVRFSLGTEDIKVYSKANGLLSDQFNYNSSYKDPGGRIYLGSVKGLISFNPEGFLKNTYMPPVYITGFQVYNKDLAVHKEGSPLNESVTYTDTIVLPYNQSSFSIDFAALSYTSPEMTEYAYRMEGLDNDWTYLKSNRKAYFTKLLPGMYVFRVKAANSSGLWNEKGASLVIEILPPFWKSPGAYLLYAILLLGGVYYGIRSYHRKIKEKHRRKLELFEHEKEKEVYQAKIEFFTNVAHEIRTPLTLIKGPMEKVIKRSGEVPQIQNNLKIMERNTDRLLELTNQLLDFRKTEASGFSLNFVKADIPELLKDNFIRFKPAAEQKRIRFKADLPLSHFCAYVDIEAFNRILSNLLNNAVKYALSDVQLILLPVGEADRTFTIRVRNDGRLIPYEMREMIFELFFRTRETGNQPGTGIGLSLARSLAELHKGTLELLQPENGMNVFSLTLPVHHEIEFNPVMSR